MIYWQKMTTGLAITLIIGGCSHTRSILVKESLEIDGRSRITWTSNWVIDVYNLSAVGDSVVATGLKSRTEIRAPLYQIQSVSTVNHARGGLWGIAKGGAIGAFAGAGLGTISAPGSIFSTFDLAFISSIAGAIGGGVIGVIAGARTTYTFVPSGLPQKTLSESPIDVELPTSVHTSTPPPEPKDHSDVGLPEWVPPGSLPTEPNTHLAGGGYFGNKSTLMGRYRRFVSAKSLHLPDAQASANLPGGPYRYYFSVGARSLNFFNIEEGYISGSIYSQLLRSLSIGAEGFRHIGGLWDPTAFVELGLINGRVRHDTRVPGISDSRNENSKSSSGTGVVATLGGRLYGKVMFGEAQVTFDTRTSIWIPSMVLGIRF